MLVLGIAMLILSCVALYIYQKHLNENAQVKKTQDKARLKAEELRRLQPQSLSIENVGPGGVLRLVNVGPEMLDLDVQVVKKHGYQEGRQRWIELEGDTGTDTVSLSVSDGGSPKITVTTKQMTLEDIGLTPESFEDENGRWQSGVAYGGEDFSFVEEGAATFFQDNDHLRPQNFRYRMYRSPVSRSQVTMVEWDDGEMEVDYALEVGPEQVEVLSLSGPSS